MSLRSMPVGITYAIWVGIGIAGSNLLGMLFFGEPHKLISILCILLIVGGVVSLTFTSSG